MLGRELGQRHNTCYVAYDGTTKAVYADWSMPYDIMVATILETGFFQGKPQIIRQHLKQVF